MIRKATVEDAPAIARIHVRTWRAAYAEIVPADFLAALSEQQRTVFWQQQLAEHRTEVLVAIENGEIAGWVSAGPSRDADRKKEVEVYAIYVSPEYWRRKIGRMLMEKIEELLPDPSDLTLWVFRENQSAIMFYKKMGYGLDEAEKEIQIGTAKLTEIRLRKKRTSKSSEPASAV